MRLWILVFVLAIGAPARADRVYVQHSGNTIVWDPLLATAEDLTIRDAYRATADLNKGTFKAFSQVAVGASQNAYAGTNAITLTNIGGETIQLSDGWLRASIDGFVSLTPGLALGRRNEALIKGALSMTHNGITSTARGDVDHVIIGEFGRNAMVVDKFVHGVRAVTESNGARVIFNDARFGPPPGIGVLDMELVMPAISLQPNDSFRWSFLLQTNTNRFSGVNFADFYNTASLSLTLPQGFGGSLSLDGINPVDFDWIREEGQPGPEPVPEPGTLLLCAGAAVAWLVARRRRAG